MSKQRLRMTHLKVGWRAQSEEGAQLMPWLVKEKVDQYFEGFSRIQHMRSMDAYRSPLVDKVRGRYDVKITNVSSDLGEMEALLPLLAVVNKVRLERPATIALDPTLDLVNTAPYFGLINGTLYGRLGNESFELPGLQGYTVPVFQVYTENGFQDTPMVEMILRKAFIIGEHNACKAILRRVQYDVRQGVDPERIFDTVVKMIRANKHEKVMLVCHSPFGESMILRNRTYWERLGSNVGEKLDELFHSRELFARIYDSNRVHGSRDNPPALSDLYERLGDVTYAWHVIN